MRNIPISLDYTKQKGGYIIYSDFKDPRLAPYIDPTPPAPGLLLGTADIISYAQQVEAYKASLDTDIIYMANTMIFLENAISKQTNGEYDTIYPYMMSGEGTFVPTYQFSGFNSKYPTPEYYHDYPVFVDEEHYSQFENEYSIIYKIFDLESTKEIQLIPDDGVHAIYSDVAEIDVIFRDTQGLNIPLGPFKASAGLFTYNEFTGILTMGDVLYNDLHGQLTALFNSYSGVQDYDAYIVLQVKIAKYRSISNLQEMTQEEVNHIATMQAIEQSILEYTYQFKHAQTTQQGLSEMFYTVLITTISTVITTVATLGIGALASKAGATTTKSLASTATKAASETGAKAESAVYTAAYDAAYKTAYKALSFTQRLVQNLGGKISSAAFISVIKSPISESLQEIFLDPYLEAIVSNIVAKSGGNIFWQVLASSLVEGGRETLTGPMSQFLFGGTQMDTNTQAQNDANQNTQAILGNEQAIIDIIAAKDSKTQAPSKLSSIFKTGASLLLGTALIGIGGPMFFGASLASGLSALQSFSKTFKHQKSIIKSIVQQSVESETAGIIDDLIWDLDMIGISDEVQGAVQLAQSSSLSESSKPVLKASLLSRTRNWLKEHKRGVAVVGALASLTAIGSVLPVIAGLLSWTPIVIGSVNFQGNNDIKLRIKSTGPERVLVEKIFEIIQAHFSPTQLIHISNIRGIEFKPTVEGVISTALKSIASQEGFIGSYSKASFWRAIDHDGRFSPNFLERFEYLFKYSSILQSVQRKALLEATKVYRLARNIIQEDSTHNVLRQEYHLVNIIREAYFKEYKEYLSMRGLSAKIDKTTPNSLSNHFFHRSPHQFNSYKIFQLEQWSKNNLPTHYSEIRDEIIKWRSENNDESVYSIQDNPFRVITYSLLILHYQEKGEILNIASLDRLVPEIVGRGFPTDFFTNRVRKSYKSLVPDISMGLLKEFVKKHYDTKKAITQQLINDIDAYIKVDKNPLNRHTKEFQRVKSYQLKQLIDVTKGLDPLYCNFFTKEELILVSVEGGVSRQHLDEDPGYDYILALFNDGDDLSYRFKLAPLRFLTSHKDIHGRTGLNDMANDVIEARMRHLLALNQMDYNNKLTEDDYFDIFREQFKSQKSYIFHYRTEVNIWNELEGGHVKGMSDKMIEKFVKRWINSKLMAESSWYSKYYEGFYRDQYLSFIAHIQNYMIGRAQGDWKSSRRPFYEWFLNVYLPNEKLFSYKTP